MEKSSQVASACFRREAVLMQSLRDFTSVFGMGTGVALSLWPPVTKNKHPSLINQKPGAGMEFLLELSRMGGNIFDCGKIISKVMSGYGGSSFTEKLEHSTILDILQIGVYAYFGWISYTNLGYTRQGILSVSANPAIIAVQLAAVLILINLAFILHDRMGGSGHR